MIRTTAILTSLLFASAASAGVTALAPGDEGWAVPGDATDVGGWQATAIRGQDVIASPDDAAEGDDPADPLVVRGRGDGTSGGAVVGFGWRFGDGTAFQTRGVGELRLLDDEGRGVAVIVRQYSGDDKYEIHAVEGERTRKVGSISDASVDRGTQAGSPIERFLLAVRVDGSQVRFDRRNHAVSETFDLGFSFSPKHLKVTDLAPGVGRMHVTRVRLFAGEADPTVDWGALRVPLGGGFVEGQRPEVGLTPWWAGEDSRKVRVSGTVRDVAAGHADTGGRIEVADTLEAGGSLDLSRQLPDDLGPGLYELDLVADADGAGPAPVRGRFMILSRELAERPRSDVPTWLGVMPFMNALDRDDYEPGFAYMDLLGVRYVRWLPGWGRVGPAPDVFDWDESDHFVELCKSNDVGIMFCLSYFGAPWTHEEAQRRGGKPMAFSAEGCQLWVDAFAVPTMTRYGDYVKHWQIWNEPDAFWNEDPEQGSGFARGFGSPANYADLVRRTWEAKDQTGHDDLLVLASLSSGKQQEGVRRLFELGWGDFFDGLVIHTYGNHLRHFRTTGALLAEMGYPDASMGSGEIGIPAEADDLPQRMVQARRVADALLSSAAVAHERRQTGGELFGVTWFVLHDRVANARFGLLTEDLQPHPAATAFATTARLLSGSEGQEATVEERGGIRIYRVERDGRPPLVAVAAGDARRSVTLRPAGDTDPGRPLVRWDLWGRQSEIPPAGDDGWQVELEANLMDGFLLVEGDVQPVFDLVAEVGPAPGPALAVEIRDDERRASRASLRVEVPDLDLRELRQVDLRDGRGRVVVPVPGDRIEPGVQYDVRVDASFDTGGGTSYSRATEFTRVRKVDAAAVESLDMPDGLDVIELTIDDFVSLGGQTPPDELAARFAFAYTDTDLVLWVETRDETHVPVPPHALWQGDGLQLAIDAEHARAPGAAFVEIDFGINQEGPLAQVTGQPHYGPLLAADRDDEAGVTRYRLTIPLAQLQLDPQRRPVIGATLIINNNDGGGRMGWLGWGGGIGEEKNPARYRELTFEPDETGRP